MKQTALTLCAALVAVSALSAQVQQAPPTPPASAAPAAEKPAAATAPSVAGNWNISMDYGQGPTDIGAVFKVEGKKVTGALSSQMGEVPLEGEWVDGKLTFVIDVQGMALTFTSTLKDSENMTGSMSGQMGDVPFVAKRVKG